MKKVFVIVVTYNGKRWYDKCFTSLRVSSFPVQTVVVDNSPGSDDSDYIKTKFPEVHIIKTNENLGFGRANNLGMRYALDNGCDYVFLLNQDAWIEQDTIERLLSIHEKHHEYGLISPMQTNGRGDSLNFLIDDGNRNITLLNDMYFQRLNDIYTITYVNAAAWLLPRDTLETIGGFCPLIYHYGEDDDYLNRLHYHGILVGLVPSARVSHDNMGERLSNSQCLYERANRENIDVFLNINNNKSIKSWRRYYLWKCITRVLRHKSITQYKKQYQILRTNHGKSEKCRAAHKLKQANWL